MVEVTFESDNVSPDNIYYIQKPFHRESDFAANSVIYDLKNLLYGSRKGEI